LAALPHLKKLGLHGTGVTAAGIEELKKAIPGLAVAH
jgi:hypothetical protein